MLQMLDMLAHSTLMMIKILYVLISTLHLCLLFVRIVSKTQTVMRFTPTVSQLVLVSTMYMYFNTVMSKSYELLIHL